MRVLALLKYGEKAASTRQRVLQYLPALADAGIEVETRSLIADDMIGRMRSPTGIFRAAAAYAGRAIGLADVRQYDAPWVHKEVFPMAPGAIEGIVARMGVPLVYDFDDAVFHNYDLHRSGAVRKLLGDRFASLLGRAQAAFCGNAYLRDYAARFCDRSIIVPTTVDTNVYVPRAPSESGAPVVGWIGSPSTWPSVEPLLPVLQPLARDGAIRVRIVGSGEAQQRFPEFEMVDWTKQSELSDLQSMDIGIMPLADTPWNRGKCGFKLIQYMACGVSTIGSPVGANREIIVENQNGLFAENLDDWRDAILALARDPVRRAAFGKHGRKWVEARYSLASQAPVIIDTFASLDRAGRQS